MLTRRTLALAVLLVTQLMVILDGTIVNVALPTVRDDLGVSDAGLAWVVNGFFVAFAAMLLPSGRLGDVLGNRRVFLAGLALFTVASAWCGLAWSPEVLVATRVVQGAGAGLSAAVVLSMIAALYDDPADRARAFGLLAFVGAAGASIGVVAGGVLTELASWRWVFLVNVPIGVAALAAAVVLVDRDRGTRSPGGLWSPLREVLRDRAFARFNAVLFTMTVAGFSFQFLSALYFQDVLGYGALRTGLAYLAVTAAIAVSSLWLSGALAARWGGERVLVGGLALFVAGLVALARFPVGGGYAADVAPWLALAGVGFGLAMPQVTSLAMARAHPGHAGLASGVVTTTQQLGGAVGLAVVAALAAARTDALVDAGAADLPAEAAGLRLGLLVAAGVLTVGAVVAASVGLDRQHRARRLEDDALGDAAHDQLADRRPLAHADHDQPCAGLAGGVQDGVRDVGHDLVPDVDVQAVCLQGGRE